VGHIFLATPCSFDMSVRPRGTTGLPLDGLWLLRKLWGGSGIVYKSSSKKLKLGQNRTIIKAALHADVHTCVTALVSNVTFVIVDNNR
jgi:hypothetical protein